MSRTFAIGTFYATDDATETGQTLLGMLTSSPLVRYANGGRRYVAYQAVHNMLSAFGLSKVVKRVLVKPNCSIVLYSGTSGSGTSVTLDNFSDMEKMFVLSDLGFANQADSARSLYYEKPQASTMTWSTTDSSTRRQVQKTIEVMPGSPAIIKDGGFPSGMSMFTLDPMTKAYFYNNSGRNDTPRVIENTSVSEAKGIQSQTSPLTVCVFVSTIGGEPPLPPPNPAAAVAPSGWPPLPTSNAAPVPMPAPASSSRVSSQPVVDNSSPPSKLAIGLAIGAGLLMLMLSAFFRKKRMRMPGRM